MAERRKTYAEIIRDKMRGVDNPMRMPLSIRELARQVGYSYEHIRKMVSGEPILSREFSDAIAKFFGLDADSMWETAQRDKVAKKFGALVTPLPPPDPRFAELWRDLSDESKGKLLKIAEGFALADQELAPAGR